MNILELIAVALSQLHANALRSLLTILGITIGIGSVVGVVSIGEGLRYSVVSQFVQVSGANLILVQPPGPWAIKGGRRVRRAWRETLTVGDIEAITAGSDEIDAAFPLVSWNAQVHYQKASTTLKILGTLPGYHRMMDWALSKGRFLSNRDVREWRRVCVIGNKVDEELFGEQEAIGREIKLNGERYTVIGVMKPRTLFGEDWGKQIVVPVSTIQKRITGNDHYDVVFVYLNNGAEVHRVAQDIRMVLERFHRHGDEFLIVTGESILENLERIVLVLKLVAGGVAGISLLVGGIGIMNVMLFSVTERTREIGIRKALGAKRRHILLQFIVESAVLSLFGGLLGVVCGLGLGFGSSATIAHFSEASFSSVVSLSSIGLAILFSGGIGVFFGVYPAARASSLHPVEALRYD